MKTINDRSPNFRTKDGRLFLVRCFACYAKTGKENYAMSVADGICVWCGWTTGIDKTEPNLKAQKKLLKKKKHAAKTRIWYATQSKKIKKLPCCVCGKEKTDGHHKDYDKPLKVTWLCRKHHKELHAQLRRKRK